MFARASVVYAKCVFSPRAVTPCTAAPPQPSPSPSSGATPPRSAGSRAQASGAAAFSRAGPGCRRHPGRASCCSAASARPDPERVRLGSRSDHDRRAPVALAMPGRAATWGAPAPAPARPRSTGKPRAGRQCSSGKCRYSYIFKFRVAVTRIRDRALRCRDWHATAAPAARPWSGEIRVSLDWSRLDSDESLTLNLNVKQLAAGAAAAAAAAPGGRAQASQ